MNIAVDVIPCELCGKHAYCKEPEHVGYKADSSYAIYHCSSCLTAFAMPMQVDEEVYDIIYSKGREIPGYNRYVCYADEVLKQKKPLDFLAKEEDVYWGVQKYLSSLNKSEVKILEVGCGLGYLTYALRQQGFDAVGLDISSVAIDSAKKRYGDHYVCIDIYEYARRTGPIYDVIIFTEVIEHVPDAKSFVSTLGKLLAPGGELVITTPNRSCFPNEFLWETEPPPVHLWWFSEKSMETLADMLGYQLRFLDFTGYNQEEFFVTVAHKTPFKPTRLSRLDVFGNVIDPISEPVLQKKNVWKESIKRVLTAMGLMEPVRKLKKLSVNNEILKISVDPKRRFPLCAILTQGK